MKKHFFPIVTIAISVLLYSTLVHSKDFTNSIGMKLVLIPSGSFVMGSHEFEPGRPDEKPQHRVTISKPFYLGIYEVSQEQWAKVMDSNPSKFKGRNKPVQNVSWDDANAFIVKLNKLESTNKYRLPTEAEWEYAARAGSSTAYCYGDDPDGEKLDEYGWYKKYATSEPKESGKLKPNKWGLYDMHGNVSEWVQDFYSGFDGKGGVDENRYYITGSTKDPSGPPTGLRDQHVIRGGSALHDRFELRSAARHFCNLNYPCGSFLGFRIVMTTE
jgi:formylglycine-generating enzyme required for sulfatase activity